MISKQTTNTVFGFYSSSCTSLISENENAGENRLIAFVFLIVYFRIAQKHFTEFSAQFLGISCAVSAKTPANAPNGERHSARIITRRE